MLSMYSNIAQINWAEVLPFIQLAYNTSFSSTMHETPFFLMFGRQARLSIDIIFGIPCVGRSTTTEEFAHSTRENLQIAFELARRNLSERIDKQKANDSKLPPITEFTAEQKVLVYKPHHSTDGPNSKLIQPWRGPHIICSKLSPVVYRIRHPDDTKQVSVHLANTKSYSPRQSAPAPDFYKLEGLFLGRTLPTPAFGRIRNGPATYRHLLPLSHKSGRLWAFDRLDTTVLTVILKLGALKRYSADDADEKKKREKDFDAIVRSEYTQFGERFEFFFFRIRVKLPKFSSLHAHGHHNYHGLGPKHPPTSPAERRATSGPSLCHYGGGCVTTRTTNIFFFFFSRVFFFPGKGAKYAHFWVDCFFQPLTNAGQCANKKKEKCLTQKTPKISKNMSPKALDTVKGS